MLIDITRPLCRGRIISLGFNDDRFVSFKYERLPNICYWCGMVSHDDKDCPLWLSSKGSLKVKDQQFGHWIRAAQVNPSRKSVMDVKGFEKKETQSSVSSLPGASYSFVHDGILALRPIPGTVKGAECSAGVDLKTIMELPPMGVARQRERLEFSEEQLQEVTPNLKEATNKAENQLLPTLLMRLTCLPYH